MWCCCKSLCDSIKKFFNYIFGFNFVFLIYNAIFGLMALVILCVGIADYFHIESIKNAFDKQDIIIIPICYVTFGMTVFLISTIGSCSAIKESKCLKLIYITLMIYIILFATFVGCVILINVNWINETITFFLENNKKPNDFLNTLQSKFDCCGYNSTSDWNSEKIPDSCCKPSTNPCTTETAFTIGCMDAIKLYITLNARGLGGSILCFAGVALFGSVFACFSL